MERYRIKVETNKKGDKFYIPQVGEVHLKGKIFKNLSTTWKNIISKHVVEPYAMSSMEEWYGTEEEALEVIEKYKKYIEKEDLSIIVETKYIDL